MTNDSANKRRLLHEVKIQVKKLTEEAVVRSYVHEENTTITALCAAVEAVLSYGIRQNRFSVLFEDRSTLYLLRRVAKTCAEAQKTLDRMDFYQNAMMLHKGVKSDHASQSPVLRSRSKALEDSSGRLMNGTVDSRARDKTLKSIKQAQARRGISRAASMRATTVNSTPNDSKIKNLWIRVALLEKVLDKILYHLATNALRYYEPYAIMADPCDGVLLADLLVGPCAIDYSRTRTTDHLFTDPPVSELIQRHGISGSLMSRGISYVAPSCQADHCPAPPTAQDSRAFSTPDLSTDVTQSVENREESIHGTAETRKHQGPRRMA